MSEENTIAQEVYDSFESSFRDKEVIPDELELVWLLKAVGRYSIELDELEFNKDTLEFGCHLDRYTIDLLGAMMKQYYQEREVSKVNKRASIVTKDISWDGTNGTKTSEKAHLEYVHTEVAELIDNKKPTAYS